AFDKQNLRDGHYTLWSPTVYITKVDTGNVPVDPAVRYLLDLVLGTPGAKMPDGGAGFDGLADVVKVGLIPECAMRVTRSEDGGDPRSCSPRGRCACYSLSKIAGASGAPAGCTPCVGNADCGDGGSICNRGFCEPTLSTTSPADGGARCFAGTATTHAQLIN